MHVQQRHLRRIIARGLSRRLHFLLGRTHSIRCLSLLTVIVVGTLEAACAFAQDTGDASPFAGTYYNKNHFAGLLEMVLPFAVMYGLVMLHRGRQRGGFSSSAALGGSGLLAVAVAIFFAII